MLGEVRAFGRGGGASGGHSLPATIFGQRGVNNRPAVIKGGVSVLRLNEQADKLCGGLGGGQSGQTLLSLAH